MNATWPHLNLIIAWLWLLLGFLSGMVLGLFFHQPNWLGGYASHQRRLYRLGHISFFGLGTVNLLFHFTTQLFGAANPLLPIASAAFVIGAITMPIGCAIMAHFPKSYLIFTIPVVSLLVGGTLTLWAVIQL